jgi:hypothetical protein
MSLYAQYDGASRLKTLFDGDQGRVEFWRDGAGRVIQRALVAAGPRISLWNTHDVIRRDALGRIQQTDFASGPLGSQRMGSERFARDSAGRVHNESYRFDFAQANALDAASHYADAGNGGSAFRTGLDVRSALTSWASCSRPARRSCRTSAHIRHRRHRRRRPSSRRCCTTPSGSPSRRSRCP